MSIFGALYAAVSGLSANSNALGIISDNISNANTVGYKETSSNFETLVTQSGGPDLYSPGGVLSSPFYNVAQQGVLQAQSSPTDLAISGGGFFVVNSSSASSGGTSFTRAGNFSVDANGNLINAAGFYLQGQPLSNAQSQAIAAGNYNQLTATSLGSLQTVNVAANAGTASATANVSLIANLPAGSTATAQTMTVPVYDSLGVSHDLTVTLTPSAVTPSHQDFTESGAIATGDIFSVGIDGHTYTTAALTAGAPTTTDIANAMNTSFTTAGVPYSASVVAGKIRVTDSSGQPITGSSITATTGAETFAGGAVTNGTPANRWIASTSFANAGTSTATIAAGDNIIQFNTDGTLNSAGTTFNTANDVTVAWDPAVSTGNSPQTLSFNLGTNGTATGLSQIGTNFSVGKVTQDGVQFGNFSGVSIDPNGIVSANYDNGLHRAIFILPIATFSDPNALLNQTGNVYTATNASGSALLKQAGTGSAGTISPSSLENSTVDIATEFSNLIITQRAYEANSKIITTADQMLQSLIQAKQ